MESTHIIRLGQKYAIAFGPLVEDCFEFVDTKRFLSGMCVWDATRLWKFIFKISRCEN